MIRLLAALVMLAGPAAAVTCQDVTFEDISLTTCTVDLDSDKLRLFHSDADGDVYGSFSALTDDHGPLPFAMNAGMYHRDRSPVGLYRENGVETAQLQLNAGPGNFGMLPNGVLCISDHNVLVMESQEFLISPRYCRDATQSGPMLVIRGELHPRFIPGSTSKFIRNGVGSNFDEGIAVFAISNEPINFHTFGRFFRDHLGLQQALYFDGKVSRLHAPQLGRSDAGFPMGPIVAVVD